MATMTLPPRFSVFAQPAFLSALVLLLANDFYLKAQYPGWLTGKVSDFAGLYLFAQFVAAAAGMRIARVALATAIAFAAWKSPLATPLIEAVNRVSPWPIARTIDPTDLVALAVLPVAIRLYEARTCWRSDWLKVPAALLAAFAIMATSIARPSYLAEVELEGPAGQPRAEVFARLDRLLVARGLACDACDDAQPYRRYRSASPPHEAEFQYDASGARLFLRVQTSKPDTETVAAEALLAALQQGLAPEFRNVTATRRRMGSYEPEWRVKITMPNAGIPLLCAAIAPEIWKANAAVEAAIPGDATGQRAGSGETDHCDTRLHRSVQFGAITGASKWQRAIHLESRSAQSWVAVTFSVTLRDYGNPPGEAKVLAERLEREWRASAPGAEVTVSRGP